MPSYVKLPDSKHTAVNIYSSQAYSFAKSADIFNHKLQGHAFAC
jgi:hypothetical protein